MSGTIMIDTKGNRVPKFTFQILQKNDTWVRVLEMDHAGRVTDRFPVTALWPGGSSKAPDDSICALTDCVEGME